MILKYGLEKDYANFSLYNSQKDSYDYEGISEKDKEQIQQNVQAILKEAENIAEKILEKNQKKLAKLAEALVKNAVLSAKQVEELLEPKNEETPQLVMN